MVINFSDLNLNCSEDKKTIKFNDAEIEIYKYLPAYEKLDLLEITLQESKDSNGGYNDFKMDLQFHLNLIYLYTNIAFSAQDKEDDIVLYENLKSSGLLAAVIAEIEEEEYSYLFNTLNDMAEKRTSREMSFLSVVRTMIDDLPAQVEAAQQAVSEFDEEKYKAVIDFAKSVNNGNLPLNNN